MRYEKKVLALACALAALLVIWGAGVIFSPDRVTARSEAGLVLSGDAGAVTAIELGGTQKLSLVKQSASWYLLDGSNRFPVQSDRVSSFLDALAAVKRLRPLAHSRDAWAGFGLDEGKAKTILLKNGAGKTLTDIAVGGYGPTGAEIYIRKAGSDESYAVDASFAAYLGYERSGWLDLRVMPQLPESDVQSVSVQSSLALDGPGKPPLSLNYRLTRSAQGWTGLSGAVDSPSADSLVRSLIALQAEDYAASAPANSFEPVGARVELSLGTGGSKVLEVGRPVAPSAGTAVAAPGGEGRFYARVAGSPYIFMISAYSLRATLKTPADLLVKK